MIDPVPAAQARADLARDRLVTTLAALKARLAPRALAQDAATAVVEKGRTAARGGIATARRHPIEIAGAAAAIGLLLARRPIARLLHRADPDATPAAPASLITDRPSAAARRKSQ